MDSTNAHVTVWDVATQSSLASFPSREAVVTLKGREIVLVRDDALVFVDGTSFREAGTLKCGIASRLVVSSDGRTLAAERRRNESTDLILVDLSQRRESRILHTRPSASGPIAFVRDNQRLICGGLGRSTIDLLDLQDGRILASYPDTPENMHAFALSHDGQTLAIAGDGGKVRLLNAETLTEDSSLLGDKGLIRSLAFSPDDRTLAVGCFDAPIQLWNVATRTEVTSLLGHASYVDGLSFSPDGSILASTSADNSVRLWAAPGLAQNRKDP
jgi:WD40 repeat protein